MRRYWFDEGGRLSLAIVRIAVAVSVLMVLANMRGIDMTTATPLYRPLGLWMLVGHQPPPTLVEVLWIVAPVTTVMMLLGLQTRLATVLSCVACIALVSLSFSTLPPVGRWSHGYNVVFLAQLALLGARSGDTLSIDALLRKTPVNVEHGYTWSLRLVQIAVGLMFIGACCFKLAAGHGLGWALSDNLRHQLLVRYDLAGLPRSAIAQWLIDDVWRYRTAALLNLVSQMAPLAAILMPRRPLVRGVVAVLFVGECLAIDAILALPNLHWIPLAAVFVDWERLFRVRTIPATPARSARWPVVYIVAFLAVDVVMTFVPRVDQRIGAYPFSSFPLFASVRAAEPWSEHRPYVVPGDHFVVEPAGAEHALDHEHRRLFNQTDPAKLRAHLELVRAQGFALVRHELALFVAPAYPAPAHFDMHPIAITGELSAAGFRTVLGSWTRTSVTLHPQNVDTTGARLVYYAEDAAPRELPATRDGDTFTFAPLPASAMHVVAIIGDRAWLVASMRSRR